MHFWDVESLGQHELSATLDACPDYLISDAELDGVLQSVSYVHDDDERQTASDTLKSEKCRTWNEMRPAPLKRLLSDQESEASLSSVPYFNALLEITIRHAAYSRAFRILQWMRSEGLRPDVTTNALYVRLLIRVGQHEKAWAFLRRTCNLNADNFLDVLVEAVGYSNPSILSRRDQIGATVKRNLLKPSVAWDVYKIFSVYLSQQTFAKDLRMDRLVITIVRSLLLSSEVGAARNLSKLWLSLSDGFISRPRRKKLLELLHVHLARSDTGTSSFYKQRAFVSSFLDQHPCLRPDSSTLFLLLRPLTRAQNGSTTRAMQLVLHYRKRWGDRVIDSRVCRRMSSIATREGRLSVAQVWAEQEERVATWRYRRALVQKVSYGQSKPNAGSRKMEITERWRWVWARRRRLRCAQVRSRVS